MGKTIFAAVVVAVFAAVATVLVMNALLADKRAADADAQKKADDVAKVERDRIERRISDLEKRAAEPRERRGVARAADDAAGAGPPALAPDGTPYVSRAEMVKYAGELAAKASAMRGNEFAPVDPVKPVEKKSLEDIARDMNLSAGEEANLRNILRESEEEMVRSLFGDKPLDDVKREVKEAKDDPDKQAALVQTMAQNGIANLGKFVTSEKRMKKRVEDVLGKERGEKFLAAPRKPVLDPEFEDLMKDAFK